jgi:hypothetical protein
LAVLVAAEAPDFLFLPLSSLSQFSFVAKPEIDAMNELTRKFAEVLHTPALDRELYDKLQEQMASLPGGMEHPDFYELWRQSEIVKNRHGGRVPEV